MARGELESAPLAEADRQMLTYAAKLTLNPTEVNASDVDALRNVGFDDAAISDLAMTTALYAFMNRVVDGLGRELPRGMDREAQRLGLIHGDDTEREGSG